MLRNYNKRSIPFLSIMLVIGLACIAQSGEVRSEKPCEVSFSTLKGLPKTVLVGTDIVNIASFKKSSQTLNDNYSAEMGGATSNIQISRTANHTLITRTYREPGNLGNIRRYSPSCIVNEFFSAINLKGKLVKGGLLLLEEKPDVEGIPDNFWVFYKSIDKKTNESLQE